MGEFSPTTPEATELRRAKAGGLNLAEVQILEVTRTQSINEIGQVLQAAGQKRRFWSPRARWTVTGSSATYIVLNHYSVIVDHIPETVDVIIYAVASKDFSSLRDHSTHTHFQELLFALTRNSVLILALDGMCVPATLEGAPLRWIR